MVPLYLLAMLCSKVLELHLMGFAFTTVYRLLSSTDAGLTSLPPRSAHANVYGKGRGNSTKRFRSIFLMWGHLSVATCRYIVDACYVPTVFAATTKAVVFHFARMLHTTDIC